MKTASTIAALLFCLTTTNDASAQFGFRVGGVQVTGRNVRSPFTGGVSRVNPYTRRMTSVTLQPVVSIRPIQPIVTPAPIVHVTPVAPVTADPFHGHWQVDASHVSASLRMAPAGYSMVTSGTRERGSYRWLNSSSRSFTLRLQSASRGVSTFRGVWIVPGRQFQMVSDASGIRYTVTRVGAL